MLTSQLFSVNALGQGFAHTPYEWSPSTVDIQMLRIGNLGECSFNLENASVTRGPLRPPGLIDSS